MPAFMLRELSSRHLGNVLRFFNQEEEQLTFKKQLVCLCFRNMFTDQELIHWEKSFKDVSQVSTAGLNGVGPCTKLE